MSITIYTDGSCSPNPGKGGWAYIALEGDSEFHVYGADKKSTNNIMELTAVIEALQDFSHYNNFNIYSDSQYVIKCATGVWKKTKNLELWKKYDEASKNKNITFTWIRGHDGNLYNEMVDKLAKKAISELL
jgi:ribonuclease HI